MTPLEAYKAALEAAAKVNDQEADKLRDAAEKFKHAGAHFKAKEALYCKWALRHKAKAIRALPVPEDAGDMVMVPREPTEKMIAAVAQALHEVEWANVRPPLSYLNDMDGGEWWERAARAAIRAMINAKDGSVFVSQKQNPDKQKGPPHF